MKFRLYNRHGPLVLSSVLIRLKIPTDSLSKTKLNEALVQQCMNLCLEAQDVLSQQASWMMLAEMRCAYTFLQEQNIDTQRKPRREEGPRYVSPRLRHLLTGLNIQAGDRLTLSEEAAFKILSLAVTISKDPELYMLLADFHYPAGTDILCVAYAISHLHPIISWPSHLTLPPQSAHGLLSIDEQQGIIKNLSLESLFNLTPRFSRTGTFSLRHSISYLLRPSTLSS